MCKIVQKSARVGKKIQRDTRQKHINNDNLSIKENGAKFRQWYGFEYEDEDERGEEKAPYQEQYSTSLQPMTERQKEEAEALARQIRPQMPNMFTDYLAENVADMVYGAGRTINGMSGGGLDYLGERYGIDTRMNDYLSLKDEEGTGNLARNLGNMTQFGGMGLGMYGLGSTGINIMRPYYNSWQIGRAYDRLKQNPFQGSGKDVITRMKNHNGETVILQRGEAIPGENGQVIAAGGNTFKKITGTRSNYGLNKAIYKHDMTKQQVSQIPKYIKRKPTEVSQYDQDIYIASTPQGDIKVVTSPQEGERIIASMYKIDR